MAAQLGLYRLPLGAAWTDVARRLGKRELALISDCSALEVSDAMGAWCLNNSLDNTLRITGEAPTDWVGLRGVHATNPIDRLGRRWDSPHVVHPFTFWGRETPSLP